MSIGEQGHPIEAFGGWEKIDDLLSEIARLLKSEIPAEEFYSRGLDAAMRGLGAAGGALWGCGESARGRILAQKLPANAWPASMAAARSQLISLVLQTGRSGVLPPRCDPAGDARPGNPTDFVLLLCPWMIEGAAAGVMEILQPPGAAAEVEDGYLKLLEAIGELVADYQKSGQIREFRERLRAAARFEGFSQAIHARIDLQSTAYAIVNEGRQLLACDRLSLLIARRRRFRLLAISGVDTIQSRAKTVELFEELAAAVTAMDEPLWYPDDCHPKPPQIETAVGRFLDDSHAKALAVLPLKAPAAAGEPPGKAVGVLVVERFYGTIDDRLKTDSEKICPACAQAVRNARELADIPLARLLRKLGWWKSASGLRRIVIAAAIAAAVIASLVLVPTDFTITARGELQPQHTREVFAQADGLVTDLRVEHGQKVAENDLLATLHSPRTDLAFKQVMGELDTARKRLTSVEAERLRIPRDTDDQRLQFDQLTAQATELKETIRNREEQRGILLQKQEELEVRSPMNGEVLTWNVRQSLDARPVRRGQALLTVADLSGPWQLELKVRDRDVSHLLDARRELGESLDVTYCLASDPARRLHGTIRKVALRAESAEGQDPSLAVSADLDHDDLPQLTAGATVTAAIYCGRRSLGYVWLHDFIDTVRGWMWL